MDTRTISVGAYSGVERDSKLLPSFMGSLTETVSLSTFSKERDLLPSLSAAKAGTARLKIIAKTRIQEASRFQDVGWDIFFTLLVVSDTGRDFTLFRKYSQKMVKLLIWEIVAQPRTPVNQTCLQKMNIL